MTAVDADGDGYFAIDSCGAGPADCNDANFNINPNALDVPYDGIDQDCSGADLTFAANNDSCDGANCHGPDDSMAAAHIGNIATDTTCILCHAPPVHNVCPGITGIRSVPPATTCPPVRRSTATPVMIQTDSTIPAGLPLAMARIPSGAKLRPRVSTCQTSLAIIAMRTTAQMGQPPQRTTTGLSKLRWRVPYQRQLGSRLPGVGTLASAADVDSLHGVVSVASCALCLNYTGTLLMPPQCANPFSRVWMGLRSSAPTVTLIKAPVINTAPTLTINQPDGIGDSVTVGSTFNINYDLADAEQTVTVAFYYDTDNTGIDGVAAANCAAAAEGTGVDCAWDTTGVTPGDYYIYGITDDGIAAQVSSYSSGTVTVSAVNTAPTLTINQPDGIGDSVTVGSTFNINYDLADTEQTVTVAFYYDTDNTGLDGVAAANCAAAAEGTGVDCAWDTTGVTPGDYYIYGITDDGIAAQVSSYSSGTVTVSALTPHRP